MILKNSFDLIFSIIEIFKGIFSTLLINKEKMIKNIDESFILALDLAELLVQEYKIPFRQSHQIIAQLVKNSAKAEDMFNKEKIEKIIYDVIKTKIEISENWSQQVSPTHGRSFVQKGIFL